MAEILGTGLAEGAKRLRALAERDLPALILGESGTGKELLAQEYATEWLATHKVPRDRYVVINCVGFSDDLIIAELFGHVRGAFTDAKEDRPGVVETHRLICLDELGATGDRFQATLLRVVETGEYQPVGARCVRKTSVKFIASTNQGDRLRGDLVERFHTIYAPPLAMRGEDLVALVMKWTAEKAIASTTLRFAAFAARYVWPGNVRELRRLVESAWMDGTCLDVPPAPPPIATRTAEAYWRAASTTDFRQDAARVIPMTDFPAEFRKRYSRANAEQEVWFLQREADDRTDAGRLRQIARSLERMAQSTLVRPTGLLRQREGFLRGTPAMVAHSGPQHDPEREELKGLIRAAGSQAEYARQSNQSVDQVRARMRKLGLKSADCGPLSRGAARKRRLLGAS